MPRRAIIGSIFAGIALVAVHIGAAASGTYTPHTTGYDFSYPQCPGTSSPNTGASFAIVGVNGGYPFTYYNTCLNSEWATASKTNNAAVYINTGYDPSYTSVDGRHMTQDCATRSAAVAGTSSQQLAWGVGCSEAQRDVAYAGGQGVAGQTMWWLDVEIGNSWSTSDLTLNQYTVNGVLANLPAATPTGVYSTPQQWAQIMGSGFKAPVAGEWHATGQGNLKRAKPYCGQAGFSGAPVWLVQYGYSYDWDYAC
jgi:hypothetical protein